MKRTLKTIMAASVLALCLTGCEKEIFSSFSEIKFKAGTVAGPRTKTAYGTIVGSSDKVQRVDWRAGDLVRITSLQAAQDTTDRSIHYADYVVQSDGTPHATTSYYSVSTISAQNRGLHWGDKALDHVFYSVYPSPGTRGKSSDSLNEDGDMQGNIPATQTPLSVSSSAPYVAAPNMIHQYMVAKRTVTAGKQKIEDGEVFLYYTPITTAIEFEVTNGMTDTLAIASIDLTSVSHNLSGTFTASLENLNEDGLYPNDTYPAFTAATGASNSASVSFGSLKLAKNQKLTFTIFLLPEDNFDDLTFRINKTDGKYIQAPLKSDATGNPYITFARCKKHFVKGLFVNEGAKWTLAFSPDVASWKENKDERDLDDPEAAGLPSLVSWDQGGESGQLSLGAPVEYKFTLATGVSATQTFDPTASNWNVKTLGITSTKDSEVEGWENEPQGWKIKTVDGNAVTGSSYTTTDGMLTVEKDGTNLKVTDNRQKISYGDNDHWTTSGTDWYRAPLSGTIDLSKRDFRTGNSISMTTANCYVIRNAGTYKIPLVYGNAVDGGSTNTQSYAPTIASGGSNGLTPFQHHLGKDIIDPYIENNTDDGLPKANITSGPPSQRRSNNFLTAAKAELVWSEYSDFITVTSSIQGTKKTQGNDSYTDGNYNSDNVRWIKFTVANNDKLRQCNAVIAVKDADNKIMWSWHIWVTNNPDLGQQAISVTNNAGNTSNFMAASALGWIDPDLYEEKDDVVIVLEQEESGEQITVTTKHPEYVFDGQGMLYQFGRKDPMRLGASSDTKTGAGIQASILNPASFYTDWTSGGYYNLWTGKESKIYTLAALTGNNSDAEEGTNLIKTIYDPSPAGYKVPSTKAFTGFTKEGKKCGSTDLSVYPLSDSNISGSYHKGWDFYTSSSKSSTIFFPAVNNRESSGSPLSFVLGRYGTSTPNSDSDNSFFEFQFQGHYVYPMTEKSSRANALCVRPIEE